MPSSDEEIDRLVAADQLRLVFVKGGFIFPASVFNAGCYTALVWSEVSHLVSVIWLIAIAVIAAGRVTLRAIYLGAPRGPADTARWARLSVAGAFINGCAWGSLAFIAFPHGTTAQLFQTIVLAAVCGVASSFSASHPPSYLAFMLPAVLPAALRLFAEPDWFHRTLGMMLLVFVAQLVSQTRSSGQALREAAVLRFRLAALNQTLESRVVERTQELQSALAGRDEFIMVASHELRTPITSLRLSAQHLELLAAEDKLGETPKDVVQRALATVVRQSRQLERLVAQLLDASRIQAGVFELALADDVDLDVIVRAVAARFERDGANAGCALRVETAPGIIGRFDGARVDQAITNLVSNAIKFGAGHPVEIAVRAAGERAHVSVADHGEGIAPDVRPRIFQRFNRSSSAKHYGGLGLGLYITRNIVQAHGGDITVDSEAGKGTRFTVELPLAVGSGRG